MDNSVPVKSSSIQGQLRDSWVDAIFSALVYIAAVHLSLKLIVQPANVALFWPPAGILLAFYLQRPRSWWTKLIILVLPLSVLVETLAGRPPLLSAAYGVLDLGEAAVAAAIIRRFSPECLQLPDLRSLRDLMFSATLACFIFGFLAAITGTFARQAGPFEHVWLTWSLAASLGMLALAPLVLALPNLIKQSLNFSLFFEATIVNSTLAILAVWLFRNTNDEISTQPALLFAPFPLLMWASLRSSTLGATVSALILTLIAGIYTAQNLGPFSHLIGASQQLYCFQLFVVIMTATPLILAVSMSERRTAEEKLRLTQFSVDQAGEAIIWINRDATVRYANEGAAILFGLAADELIGRDIQDFDPTWPRERWDQAWKMLQRERAITFTREVATFNGPCLVEITTSFISFQGEEVYVAFLRDIRERERVAEALRASEAKFRTLVEGASDGIFVCDSDGNYLEANPTACRMVGYSKEEILNMRIQDLVAPEDLIANPIRLAEIAKGQVILSRRRLKNKEGGYTTVEINAQRLSDGRLLGIARNISVQLEYEEALRRSSEQNARIIESLPCGVVRVDLNLIVLMINRVACEFAGVTADTAIGKSLRDFGVKLIGPDGIEHNPGEILVPDVVKSKRQVGPVVASVKFQDGHTKHAAFTALPFDNPATGDLEGFIFAFLDVTQQRDDEQMLREAEARLRLSVETLPVVFWTTDSSLRLTSVLGGGIAQFVESGQSVLGKTVAEVFSPERGALPISAHDEALKGQQSSFDWGWENHDYQLTIEPLRDSSGQIIGTVCLGVDISERKRVEKQIRDLNEELEDRVTERTIELEASIKELESFSYSVSHDLRSPLRALSGYAFILLEDYRDQLADEAAEMLARIDINARRMSSLIDDLLAFSRMGRQPLNKSLEDISLIARAAFEEAREAMKSECVLEIADLPPAMCDQALVHQVFANLFTNAIKFSRDRPNQTIKVGVVPKTLPTEYFVEDHGIGFESRHAETIFGVFTRLNPLGAYEGTGVGLAIVQRIVHRHGGRVWAESTPGVGTKVIFTLGPESQSP